MAPRRWTALCYVQPIISSNLRGCSKSVELASFRFDQELHIPVFTHTQAVHCNIKLKVEWKITLYRLSCWLTCAHDVDMVWSQQVVDLGVTFADLALELSVLPGLGWLGRACGGFCITCAFQAHLHHHNGSANAPTWETITIPTGCRPDA